MGAIITFKGLLTGTEGDDRIGGWAWRPLVFILASNLAFGVLLAGVPLIHLPPAGLIIAIYVLTIVASLAGRRFNFRDVLILASGLAAISYVAFIAGLKLLMPVWPGFIGG